MSFHRAHVLDGITSLLPGGVIKISGGVEQSSAGSPRTRHCGLQRSKSVGLQVTFTRAPHRPRAARTFANVAIAQTTLTLTGIHHGRGTAGCPSTSDSRSRIYCRLRLGDTCRSRDRGEGASLAFASHRSTDVHALCGFLRHAFDLVAHFGEPAGDCAIRFFDLCLIAISLRRRDSESRFRRLRHLAPSRMGKRKRRTIVAGSVRAFR